MKNKKKMLARLIYVSGAVRLCRRILSGRLVVFNYHRIRTDDPLLETPFDSDVFGPSQSEFRREMEWLKRNTRVISETDLLDHLRGERALNGLNVMITFDDGYIDNYTLAYPVLKELEIPAVFFIPTDLIQARRLGWWDIAAYLVKNTNRAEISHFGNTFDLRKEKIGTIRYFHSILRKMKPELGRELIYELAEYCNVPFPNVQEQGSQLMDWDQIRTVSKNGIGIGSHTHSHPTLSTLNPDDQRTGDGPFGFDPERANRGAGAVHRLPPGRTRSHHFRYRPDRRRSRIRGRIHFQYRDQPPPEDEPL